MNKVVKVEGHTEVAPVRSTIAIKGLEEVPSNIIPIPFYKLVQPGSTNVTMSDGQDAIPGSIYQNDSKKAEPSIRIALLRAKRMVREFPDDDGKLIKTVSIGMLGINTDGFTPFILNVSIASFSNFGGFIKQLKDKKAENAYDYPIVLTTQKKEEKKNTTRGEQMVKYYVFNFEVEEKPFDQEAKDLLVDAYNEFAGSLDRNTEPEEAQAVSPDLPF